MYYHIDDVNETRTLKSTSGQFIQISVGKNGTLGSTLVLYDGLSDSSPVISRVNLNSCSSSIDYNIAFDTGLTYKTSGGPGSITIVYQ